jgi:hypothetical protein
LIARDRDVTDVAMVTTFGPSQLSHFNVITNAMTPTS